MPQLGTSDEYHNIYFRYFLVEKAYYLELCILCIKTYFSFTHMLRGENISSRKLAILVRVCKDSGGDLLGRDVELHMSKLDQGN